MSSLKDFEVLHDFNTIAVELNYFRKELDNLHEKFKDDYERLFIHLTPGLESSAYYSKLELCGFKKEK